MVYQNAKIWWFATNQFSKTDSGWRTLARAICTRQLPENATLLIGRNLYR